ncbi:uncharacterized protein DNG_07314 [Cephalotrichum gorgonifer]|uniref:DUF1330 domain-containing protein n=1 Tax=Cephalotrichum gorgonifer TaxID=2041049 RepID=A0AAE8N366_9PEZI|nr:uncharacterized protein DNG_07314 [Cephalotrichum gorgonifer]
MVLCTLHMVALKQGATVPDFLTNLRKHNVEPIVKARVLRWMILPTTRSAGHLLGRNKRWDLLIGLGPDDTIPEDVAAGSIDAIWTVSFGVSSKVLSGYNDLNSKLSSSPVAPIPLPQTGRESSQNLEASSELISWISDLPEHTQRHPISMLNLLSFNPGKKPQYQAYGREFSQRVGSAFGGHVKIAARVAEGEGRAREEGWDEIAFVHYPTLSHFAGMSASKEYQDVNREYRLGALKDTFILCVVEVDDSGDDIASGPRGKL